MIKTMINRMNKKVKKTIYLPDGFLLNSSKTHYSNLPIKYYPNSIKETHLEFHTGAYNYLFSKNDYTHLTALVDLSKSTYTLSSNQTNYNGYVLFNHEVSDQIDVGLCIRYINNEVTIQPFYYYMGGIKPKEFYLDSVILSKFTRLDDKTFTCNDNFKIVFHTTNNGWYFSIEVINSNMKYEKYIHIGPDIHKEKKGRFLVGASLVPINDDLWDPLCGASFTNILFNGVILDNNTHFYPSSPSMLKGYSQGYPFADYKFDNISFTFETIYKKRNI